MGKGRFDIAILLTSLALVFGGCSTDASPEGVSSPTWVRDEPFGIALTLSPSTLPSETGAYQVEVSVSQHESWTGIWACKGLGGVLRPDVVTPIEDVCSPLTPMTEEVEYPTVVTVDVDDQVIAQGGLVIGVNAAFGDWAGTALLTTEAD